MLNWDSVIITSQEPIHDSQIAWEASLKPDMCNSDMDSGSEHEQKRGKRVMKVLYLSTHEVLADKEEGSISKKQTLWGRWQGDPGVEKLRFNKEHLIGLLAMLEQSSGCLPPSINSSTASVTAMEGMHLGFIAL